MSWSSASSALRDTLSAIQRPSSERSTPPSSQRSLVKSFVLAGPQVEAGEEVIVVVVAGQQQAVAVGEPIQ